MSDRVTDSLAEALTSLMAQRRELDESIERLRVAERRIAALLPRRRRAVASVKKARKGPRRGRRK
jgi:hypothetical protein